ncbi:MAG: hypothetical protein K2Q06_00170, partial [Parvularculaceae bacterium]|nr:hypothetical protein [Parvularculaceae bacterium]
MKSSRFRSTLKRGGAIMVAALVAAPLLLAAGCSQPSAAGFVGGKRATDQVPSGGYAIGLAAYQTGQFAQAIDIWKRYSMAGDVRSKKVLGDV